MRAFALTLLFVTAANARLTRFNSEFAESTGGHFLLRGHFSGELDPKDRHNSVITDIEYAPRNAHGMVEYTATFSMIGPNTPNGVLFYSVPNRGNGAPAATQPGEISVVSGWQGDIFNRPDLQTIQVPTARKPGGAPLTGRVFERFINMKPGSTTLPFVALTYQRPLTLETAKASLMKRSAPGAQPVAIPSTEWAFADCTAAPFPGTPDPAKICAKSGFDPAFSYELSFTAKDPLVLGIGYAATRDLNSWLRYESKDDAGNDNPIAGKVKWALSRGTSQSGNFLRSFLNLGFNQDEKDRIVWDGVAPHIAARQLVMNLRFAVVGGAAGLYEPGSEAALWWSDYNDAARHRPRAGLLDRCTATHTCPKIMETFGGLEFWYLRESPDLVGTDAKSDIPLPPNVRRYFFPATSHGGGRGGFNVAGAPTPACVLAANPNPESDSLRALTAAFVAWVTEGKEMPPSRYPTLTQHELIDPAHIADISALPAPNNLINRFFDYDFGPDIRYNDLSGVITKNPPAVRRILPALVPKIDSDGMDATDGVPSVLRQAPLGSYLGWNLTASGFDQDQICGLTGGYVPFAKTRAEREAKHDTRLSLEERYGNHAGYAAAVKAAADKAVADRFLLPEDAARLIREAESSAVLLN